MFHLSFETDNAAFDGCEATETAGLLREVARRVREGELEGKIRDVNGNTIGEYKLDNR